MSHKKKKKNAKTSRMQAQIIEHLDLFTDAFIYSNCIKSTDPMDLSWKVGIFSEFTAYFQLKIKYYTA